MKTLLLAVTAFTAATAAHASSITFYTDKAAFDSALASESSFDFDSIVSGSDSVTYNSADGLTDNGFNFVGTTGNDQAPYFLVAVGPDFFSNLYNVVPGQSVLEGPAVTSGLQGITNGLLTVTLPSGGYSAFGLLVFDNLDGSSTPSGSDTVNLTAGASTGTVVTPGDGTAFIGFTSSTPITSITLQGTGAEEFPDLSEVYYGTAATPSGAPEPGTMSTLLLSGAAALALLKWRKRDLPRD